MLKIGQKATVEITGYTSEGLGVCRIDGCAVFVPNAIRSEVCEVAVSYVSRNSAQAKLTKLLEPSAHRMSRRLCPDSKRCGGCALHHMDYAEELCFKAQKVTDALNRIGGQCLNTVPILGGDGEIHCFAEKETVGRPDPRPPYPCADAPVEHVGTNRACPLQSETNPAAHRRAPLPDDSAAGSAHPPVPSACLSYRNKAQYPVQDQNGKVTAGFYRQRTHEVIPIERCAILPPEFDAAKEAVLRWANENRVPAYDEATGKGLLRHVYLRRGVRTGQVMVCIVAAGDRLPQTDRMLAGLRQSVPGLQSVVLAVNQKPGNAILGDEFHTLFGTDAIEDELCGFRFRLSPRSFYQVNPAQAERLYELAVSLADLKRNETVLDLYCGTGTITLALSRAAGKAVGVEIVPQAIEDAKENARRNGVENTEFFCADASEAARRFAAKGTRPDCIVVDPPRKGLAPDVIDAIAEMSPARLVYVSCDPATLARDVSLLTARGYDLKSAEAIDMFPRTFHVETVVQLVRKNPDMTVSVTLNLEDADLTASEAKATYEQIKAYVMETFGFRVTSLQIAQTKRKLGLPTGEHYNLSQKENQVIPNCPPEKEAAIREAFRFFRMMADV